MFPNQTYTHFYSSPYTTHSSLILCVIFCQMVIFLHRGIVSLSLHPRYGGPSIFGYPRLLIRYVLSICSLLHSQAEYETCPATDGVLKIRFIAYQTKACRWRLSLRPVLFLKDGLSFRFMLHYKSCAWKGPLRDELPLDTLSTLPSFPQGLQC